MKTWSAWVIVVLVITCQAYGDQGAPAVIPKPVHMELGEGEFLLNPDTQIGVSPDTEMLGRRLKNLLAPAMGSIPKVTANPPQSNLIELILQPHPDLDHPEGYLLKITKDRVRIQAARPAGIFYGCMTLLQLLPHQIFREAKVKDVVWKVPCLTIRDFPRFKWRGAMLDVCRYFMPKEFLKKFIDLLALHKMNVFHIHLTEDQGWRIEIKKYPKLTQVGAWRKETLKGHYRDQPHQYDNRPHGGYYTQEDIRELVAYAQDRFVTLVPEIEMPGHAQAAIASYPELGNLKQKLPVRTIWGVNKNIFNAEEKTILFLQDVLTEVLELFPGEFIHIGGDEAVKTQWKESQRIQARIKELGLKDEHELQSWFIGRMDRFLTQKGRRLVGWDEILEGGLAPGATVMSWRGDKGGITAAKAGHDVVMAPTHSTYLDYYQSKSKNEPLAIGGHLPLKKVYRFNPIPKELTEKEAQHILGAQGQIWTEYIPNPKHAEYMGFPRLCALAEVVWSPNKKDYENFILRLKSHLLRLNALDVNFRPLDDSRLIYSWKAGKIPPVVEIPITEHLVTPGTFEVHFQYNSGAHRLDIDWVQLLEDDKVISEDRHPGVTGHRDKNNTYHLVAPCVKQGSCYTLKASIHSDGGQDSNGDITLKKLKQ